MNLMTTLAQLEREQCAERVAANFQARASRGLYNGGVLPVGYKLISEKPGFLAIDDDQTGIVRMAFATYLTEGTLTKTAKHLNTIRRKMQGGGSKPWTFYRREPSRHSSE